jgi:hypothetical protein
MTSKLHGTLTGFLVLATLAACGNDTTAPPRASVTWGDTGTEPTPPDATDTPDAPDTTAGATSGTVSADDFCHVDITGDVTASFDSPGGYSSISYGPWVPTSGGTVAGITLDDSFFIMNCQGGEGELVSIGLGLDQHLPMAPASYPIRKADNIFGSYDSNPPVIQVAPYIGSGEFFWGVSAESVFTITEFDASHIAGNFQFFVSEAKNDFISDSLPAKTAVIVGTFNLKNPN